MTSHEYLHALYGRCEPLVTMGQIVVVASDRKTRMGIFSVDQLVELAEFVQGRECFIKINLMNAKRMLERSDYAIGRADEVSEIVSIHLDIDANKPGYGSREEMLAALNAMPVPPSLVVNSNGTNGGLHGYWLLRCPHLIRDEADRARIATIAQRWLNHLRKLAGQRIDGTANGDRLLRPIGSIRSSGNAVSCHEYHPERLYELNDFVLPEARERDVVNPSIASDGRKFSDLSPTEKKRWDGMFAKCEIAEVGTRSEADFSLLLLAHELRLDCDEVESEVCGISKFEERRDYFDRSWQRAREEWAKIKPKDEASSTKGQIIPLVELVSSNPKQAEPLVNGLLRQGQTMNIIAATKVGKSWLASQLAFSVANGIDFLGRQCKSGKVLLIDYELQPSDLSFRLSRVAIAMNVDLRNIDVMPLRGSPRTINELSVDLKSESYSLVVLDTLSRSLPAGISENENAALVGVYSVIDGIAKSTGAAVAIVHHSTKGSQADKSVVDIGSGASAIARSVDTHCAIRPHEEEGHAVLEAVCRSFISPKPQTIKWSFPLWTQSELCPQILEAKSSRERKQIANDEMAFKEILSLIPDGKTVRLSKIRRNCSFGVVRANLTAF